MAYQRTIRTLAAALALVSICTGRGAAQPSGLIETPIGNRLAINVMEVRALTVEPRFVPEGMYYATVHLTVANLAGTGSDRTLLQPSAFRVMTHQGTLQSGRRGPCPARRGSGGQPLQGDLSRGEPARFVLPHLPAPHQREARLSRIRAFLLRRGSRPHRDPGVTACRHAARSLP
jgi:hypothetical protein